MIRRVNDWSGHEGAVKGPTVEKRVIKSKAQSAFGKVLTWRPLLTLLIAGLAFSLGSSAYASSWRAILESELRQFGLMPVQSHRGGSCNRQTSVRSRAPSAKKTANSEACLSSNVAPAVQPPPAEGKSSAIAPDGDVKPAEYAPYWTDAERWAWDQIRQGKEANFEAANFKKWCGNFDPKEEDEERRGDECRDLSARFLQDILTRMPWQEVVPSGGVQIRFARIVKGDVILENVKLSRPIVIKDSRFFSGINLNHAQTDYLILLDGSRIDSAFTAEGLTSKSDLELLFLDFENDASFDHAKISGLVDMKSAIFWGNLKGAELALDGSLRMAYTRSESKTATSFVAAKIKGDVDLEGSSFAGPLSAESLAVDGHLWMHKAQYNGKINMVFAHVGGNLDLRRATLSDLDLSGASITGELRLGGNKEAESWGGKEAQSCIWEKKNGRAGHLNLRNAHIGNLAEAQFAWPEEPGTLELDGFTFLHLGGFEGETWTEIRKCPSGK